MTTKEITFNQLSSDLELLADGFEKCFVGVGHMVDGRKLAMYDRRKCIELLMEKLSSSEEEAEDFFSYNVENTYYGTKTPLFIDFNREIDEG